MPLGERSPCSAPSLVESRRVDHRRQPPLQALRDDQVEHLERVTAGALVALAEPDGRPQAVRGDDLIRVEPLGGPMRLARGRRSDEHDEAWIGQAERRSCGLGSGQELNVAVPELTGNRASPGAHEPVFWNGTGRKPASCGLPLASSWR
jgi:hypothetical protein